MDGDTLAFSLAAGPAGMTVDGATGSVQWTPTADQIGEHAVSLDVADGHGGAARQDYSIRVGQAIGNRAPFVVTEPVTEVVVPFQPIQVPIAFQSSLVRAMGTGEQIAGLAVSSDGQLYVSSGVRAYLNTSIRRIDLATGAMTVFKDGLASSGRIALGDPSGAFGDVLLHTDGDYPPGYQGAVFSTDRTTGVSTTLVTGAPNRSIGDPFGVALGKGGAFGTDLYVMDFQGWSSQTPILERIRPTGAVETVAEGGPWTLDALPLHVEFGDPSSGFGDYAFVADPKLNALWRVSPLGEITPFPVSEPIDPLAARFGQGGSLGSDLYIVNGDGRVLRIAADGAVSEFARGITVPPGAPIADLAFAPDGNRLFVGYGENLYVIEPRSEMPRYAYGAGAIDPDGDAIAYSLVDGPPGMTIDAATGRVEWAIPADQMPSTHAVSIRADDGRGGSDTQTYSLDVVTVTTGEIRGHKFHDVSEDGIWADSDAGPERALAGWTIYLDANDNGVRDPGERSTETGSDGAYAFTDLLPGSYVVREELRRFTYDAANDFSIDMNPAGAWTYGHTAGMTAPFVKSDSTFTGALIDGWSATSGGSHVIHNRTNDTVRYATITHPVDVLNLDPSFDGRNAVVRWTAFVAATYRVAGRFEGLDSTTTEVGILHNGALITGGAVGGFGAQVPFDFELSVVAGDTIDFSVGQGWYGSLYDSTGLAATIAVPSWRPTTPLSGEHAIDVAAGMVADDVDFGNTLVVPAEIENTAPEFTSTPVDHGKVGFVYRYQAAATDADGDRLTFDLPLRPRGMVVDPTNGLLFWTPREDQVGTHSAIVRVSDGLGGIDLQPLTVRVDPMNGGAVITSQPALVAELGRAYQYAIRAQDPELDPIAYSLVNGPVGMGVDPLTGSLTWVPSALGPVPVTVLAVDSFGSGQSQAFELVVIESLPNEDPVITSMPRRSARLGTSYFYGIQATDPNGDPLQFSLDAGPAGMVVSAGGLLEWTPSTWQFGDHDVRVRVDDGRGGTAIQSFVVSVISANRNGAPVIESTPPNAATVGRDFAYDLIASDPDGDPIAYSLDQFPRGMSIDALRGALRWTPTAEQLGPHTVVVRAMDTLGASVTQEFEVTARGANLPPRILSSPPTNAAADQPYEYAVRARDPEGGPLAFALLVGSGDMRIDAAGVMRWTPTDAESGSVDVVVRVTDDRGAAADQPFSVIVAPLPPNHPPEIRSRPIVEATIGRPYEYLVTATDADGDAPRFALLEAPTGMTIDEFTGRVRWTPTQTGNGRVTVLVGDLRGGEAEQSFEVLARDVNQPPAIVSTPATTSVAGATYRYDLRANDPNGDPLAFRIEQGPAGMSIDGVGRLTWPTSAADIGSHAVRVMVSDGRGGDVPQSWTLAVDADTSAPRVALQVGSNPALFGDDVPFLVSASDNVRVESLRLIVGELAVPLDGNGRGTVRMNWIGNVEAVATAIDAAGNAGERNVTILVIDPTVTEAPFVELHSPTDGITVTSPTDVLGTVEDANLVSWSLEVAPMEEGEFREIANGAQPIAGGLLGKLDPTLLQNDTYRLRLTATNTGGLSASTEILVNVAGALKLGNFTLSFTDLALPLAGIPISIVRTYDTLRSGLDGELGFGWRLEYRDVDLRTSVGTGVDEAYGLYAPFRDGTRVYVTLPGGAREGFTFRPKAVGLFDPYQREQDVPPEYVPGNGLRSVYFVPSFVPDKGVTSRLTVPRYQLTKVGREYFQFGGGFPYNPKDSAFGGRFLLTTKEGATYRIDAETRQVATITDRNGAYLAFVSDGITSSAGGRVAFERDARGRIVAITDPGGGVVEYQYDVRGDLVAVRDPEDHATSFQYRTQPAHYLEQIVDPLGRPAIRNEYDAQGRLIGIVNADGQRTGQQYDAAHSTQTVVDAMGGRTSHQYDDRGNVVATTNALGQTITRTFDDDNNVLSFTDALGRTTRYAYDGFGNIAEETDPLGGVNRKSFDSSGNLLARSDALGRVTHYAYDANGNSIGIEDASGNTQRFAYDRFGQPSEAIDPLGNTTRYEGDAEGHLLATVDASGQRRTFTYDTNGLPTTIGTTRTGPAGQVTQTWTAAYNARGDVTSVTSSTGATETTGFDSLGRVVAATDALGHTKAFVYSSAGQLDEIVHPDATPLDDSDNPRERHVHDALGRMISETDASGRTTVYRYDAIGRLLETIFPDSTPGDLTDNPRTTNEYNAAGELVAATDELGNRTRYSYDAAGRRIETLDALGHSWRTEYDAVGQITASIDPLGRATRYRYDDNGNLIETVHADGARESRAYDAAGRVIASTDALERTTRYEYDALGRITAVVDALVQRTAFAYDESGNRISQSDANGRTTRYEYDIAGGLAATVLPLGQRSETVFDAGGRVTESVTFNGETIRYVSNERDWLVEKQLPGGATVRYAYDPAGRLVSMVDSAGTTVMDYDARGRLTSRTEPDGRRIEYAYDAASRRTAIVTPSGTTSYAYDSLGRLTSVADPAVGTTRYEYDSANRLIRTTLPNGVVEERTYDNRDRLVRLVDRGLDGVLATYDYELDATGRVRQIHEGGGRVVTYAYDALYRLVGESIADPVNGDRTRSYVYDPVGNRRSMTDSLDGTTAYEYDANDRLLTATRGAEVTRYTYDAAGNTLSRIANATDQVFMTWDAEDRLIQADQTVGATTRQFTYRYDAEGRRVARTIDDVQTRYLLDTGVENAQVVEEYTSGGVILARFVQGANVIAQSRGGSTSLYLPDAHGDTRLLLALNGQIADRYTYDAFGNVLADSGNTLNELQYGGEQYDPLGFLFLRARWYDPTIGRFLSPDPFPGVPTIPMSLHPYVYMHDDPVNGSDPSGKSPLLQTVNLTALRATIWQRAVTVATVATKTVLMGILWAESTAPGVAWSWKERMAYSKEVQAGAIQAMQSAIQDADKGRRLLGKPFSIIRRKNVNDLMRIDYLYDARRKANDSREDRKAAVGGYYGYWEGGGYLLRDIEYYFVGRAFGPFGGDPTDHAGNMESLQRASRNRSWNHTLGIGGITFYELLKLWPVLRKLTQNRDSWLKEEPSGTGGGIFGIMGIVDTKLDDQDGGPLSYGIPRNPKFRF